jgi:hypothetical protein
MRVIQKWSKTAVVLAALVLGMTTIGATRLSAQDGGSGQKLPTTPEAAVLQAWNETGAQLVTMAEDWPEDKYSYQLNKDTRTFAQVMLHIAGSNYDVVNRLSGTKQGDGRNDPPVAEYKTKAQVVDFLKKSIVAGAAEIQKEGDAGVTKNLYMWIGYTEHMGEHYGLLVAYYRANNVVPPSSRKK